jgi:ABC-type nitrate/sulfonate/bicarbonate transport system substrate-binding protein
MLIVPFTACSQLTKITVSYPADTPASLPVFTAKETGIYSKNGLDVQLVRIAGTVAVMALIAGEPQISQVAGPAVIASSLGSSDAVIIAAGTIATDYVLVSQKDIKIARQLKGGVLGVATLTGAAIFSSQFALRKLGLDPNKDVSFVAIGQSSDRFLALRTGRVQATLLTPPQWIMAEREGFNVLTDLAELPFPYNTISTTRRFMAENPETVRKFVKSQIEAVHLLKTDRETGLKVLAKYLRQKLDREILQKTFDQSVTDAVLPRKQYPDIAGIKTVLELIGDSKAAKAKPEQFVDMRLVKELDESGYIDNLYKRVSK